MKIKVSLSKTCIGRIPLPKKTEKIFKDKTKYTRKEKRKSPAYSVGDFLMHQQ